jgi:hypothetical protein
MKMQLWAKNLTRVLSGLILLTSTSVLAVEQDPAANLGTLKNSGYFINSNSSSYPVHAAWAEMTKLMDQSAVFDRFVSQIEEIVCGTQQNKSVLVIGEPSDTWRYIFARVAQKAKSGKCVNTAHVEVDISKIEAGHSYVGQVDEYWRDNLLEPVDGRNAILYFSSLNQLMGLGSHRNDDTGIEAEYANNISSGRMRSVAFMNKYEYEFFIRSKDGYVLNSFARVVKLDDMTDVEVAQLQNDFLRVLAPNFVLPEKEQQFLNRTVKFYLPNVLEPQRSIAVLKKLILSHGGAQLPPVQYDRLPQEVTGVESEHPYLPNTNWEKTLEYPEADMLALNFESFVTESNYDVVDITDIATGQKLDSFSGSRSAFETKSYPTNKIKISFRSDSGTEKDGFKVNKVIVFKRSVNQPPQEVVFNREELRRAVMEIAQVPSWVIDRRFDTVKELRARLDGDVVGCAEAKDHAVLLAKNGYVGGRTDDKPVATHMFVGPTGTGKSYIAKRLADFLGIKLITFDMTSYRTPDSFDRFLDSLAESLVLYPYAIYLFEEVDKADTKILDRLYFMTDEGVFYDKYQRPLFARGAYIIITTNAAEEQILQNPNDPNLRELVDAELRKMFRPSFLNRMDKVSIFKPFTDAEYRQLAQIMITKKIGNVQNLFDWTMTVDSASIDYAGLWGRSARYGARPMERLIDSMVTAGVAEWQLAHGPLFAGAQVEIQKLAAQHDFQCRSDQKDVTYTVTPEVNGGSFTKMTSSRMAESSAYRALYTKILHHLQSQPVFTDRD